jgi:FkbM family methyltransferase
MSHRVSQYSLTRVTLAHGSTILHVVYSPQNRADFLPAANSNKDRRDMSILRSILRIKPVNHAARAFGRAILPRGPGARFERKLPLVDPFTIPMPNGQLIHFEPFGDICSKCLKFGGWNAYETPSIELFFALAQHARVTFDVGAYLGYFGLVAAAASSDSRAFLFEAVPQIAEYAARIAARNPHLHVRVISGAVSNAPGTISLFLPDDPMNSDTSTNSQHRPNRREIKVQALTLDEFVRENRIERVDLLKIDTETTEPAVLAGFSRSLAQFRPPFICEVLPGADVPALEQFCRAHNYGFAWICDAGLMERSALLSDPEGKHLNYLFFPRDGRGAMSEEIHARLRKGS